MKNISSKYLSIDTVKKLLEVAEEDKSINCDGILLIMPFGIVYGKFMNNNLDNLKTISDILLSCSDVAKDNVIKDNMNIIGDGSQVILKDATIKYPTGITLKMNEVFIFCDQVCGYYPIDLSVFESQTF